MSNQVFETDKGNNFDNEPLDEKKVKILRPTVR